MQPTFEFEFSEERPDEKNVYSIAYSTTEDRIVGKMKMVVSFHPLGVMYGNRIEYVYDISFEPPTIAINLYRHNHSWNGTGAQKLVSITIELTGDYETPWWLKTGELRETVETEGAKKTIQMILDYIKDLFQWTMEEYFTIEVEQ